MRYVLVVLLLITSSLYGQIGRHPFFAPAASTPLVPFTDDFSSGTNLGARWTNAGTWTISSGSVSCTPNVGAELTTNGNLETWTNSTTPQWWNVYKWSTGAVTQSSIVHGGSYSAAVYSVGTTQLYGFDATKIGKQFLSSFWIKASTPMNALIGGLDAGDIRLFATSTSWVQYIVAMRCSGQNFPGVDNSVGDTLYVDDASLKEIVVLSSIATVETGVADVDVSVKVTGGRTATTFSDVGVIVSFADTLNYVRALLTSSPTATVSCALQKFVNGTMTSVKTGTVTYAAGAAIRVTKSGETYELYYNGTQVSTDATISDVELISNTKHGIFSTYSGNTLDDFSVAVFP